MPDTINNADDAVNAALEEIEQGAEGEENAEETPAEEPEEGGEGSADDSDPEDSDDEEEESGDDEEEQPDDLGLPQDQVKQAVALFKAISGQNGAAAIKQIARQAGIELAEDFEIVEDPSNSEASDEDIKAILEGELAQFKFLAGPIAKALQKISEKQKSTITKVQQDINANEIRRGFKEEIKDFITEQNLKDDVSKDPVTKEIFNLSKQFPYQGADRKEFRKYLGDLHTFALAKLGKSKSNGNNSQKNDKIKRNLASREAQSAGTPGRKVRKPAPANLTAEDAVAAAIRGELYE